MPKRLCGGFIVFLVFLPLNSAVLLTECAGKTQQELGGCRRFQLMTLRLSVCPSVHQQTAARPCYSAAAANFLSDGDNSLRTEGEDLRLSTPPSCRSCAANQISHSSRLAPFALPPLRHVFFQFFPSPKKLHCLRRLFLKLSIQTQFGGGGDKEFI